MIILDYYTATSDFTTPDLARAFAVSNCKYQTCLISTIPGLAASDDKEQSKKKKKSVGSLTLHTFRYKRRLWRQTKQSPEPSGIWKRRACCSAIFGAKHNTVGDSQPTTSIALRVCLLKSHLIASEPVCLWRILHCKLSTVCFQRIMLIDNRLKLSLYLWSPIFLKWEELEELQQEPKDFSFAK